jgi:ABC-type dipeptide/oligopeptide/nickel transport system permease component
MKLRWAFFVAVGGFFLMTLIAFAFYYTDTYSSGDPGIVVIRISCHQVTQDEAQTLINYYQPKAPVYVQYFLWLDHALTWQWEPNLPGCPITTLGGSPPVSFELGLVGWISLTIATFAYSLRTRRVDLPGSRPPK